MTESTSNATVPAYSLAERDRRWGLARAFMEREGLDALLVFGEHVDAGPAPFCLDTWFTNDKPGSIVVVPRDGEILAIVPFTSDLEESARRGDALWIPLENVRVGPTSTGVVAALDELGVRGGKVGVAGLEPYGPYLPEGLVPYRLWKAVIDRCADAVFTSIGIELLWLTAVLSDEEIAVVRHSAQIGDAMAQAMLEAARPGVSESEVFAAGMAAAHTRGTVVPWMQLWSGPEPLAFGPPPWAYRPQPPRVLQEGDVINTEVFCNFGMRSTQSLATIAVGEVHPDVEYAEVVARAAYQAGVSSLRPGCLFEEVVSAMREPVEAAGGMVRVLIHSINPFGARGGGGPTRRGDLVLRPGMTFVLEPRCVVGRRVVTVGGTVLVGPDSGVELNPYTARLLRTASTTPSSTRAHAAD